MASVSSLDKDMRNIRLSKYTPQAANEVRTWIESVLGEPLATGDVLEALKDGVTLCKLINLASPSANVRFKSSTMPFVQMENISHFLRACQQPPISLHSHDIFQTVDLYESKDPAQVLQCIAAFSRRAHAVQPSRFPHALGGEKSKTGAVTPQSTGGGYASGGGSSTPRQYGRSRGESNTSETSSATSYATSQASSQAIGGRGSPNRTFGAASPSSNGALTSSSSGGVSSWSKRQDEGATTPAWNIHQYGYMGGASQGNQGITFGGRRQITTPGPKVPSLAEKEKKRKEQQEEAERLRVQAEEAEHKQKAEREAEEEREKAAEERRWEEETRKQREGEKLRVKEEKRRWEEEERRWKEEERLRAREEKEAEARILGNQQQTPDARPKLQGQFLSQYQAEQQQRRPSTEDPERIAERERVRELERQLEEAKEREARYERERQERLLADAQQRSRPSSRQVEEERHPKPISLGHKSPAASVPFGSHMGDEQDDDERSLLKQAWQSTNATHDDDDAPAPLQPPRPLPVPEVKAAPPQPPRPLPSFDESQPPQQPPRALPSHDEVQQPPQQPPRPLPSHDEVQQPPQQPPRPLPTPQPHTERPPSPSPPAPTPNLPTRPLPNPASYSTGRPSPSSSPTRKSPFTRPISTPSPPPPAQPSSTSIPPPPKTSSSLLRNEIALDLARQAEWAESQKSTASATATGPGSGSGPGESWDVHQYGYLGGDSQNRGNLGIGGGGGRRQVLGVDPGRRVGGPREMPK